MATAARNTTEVTNFEATPVKLNNPQHFDAKLHIAEVTLEIAAADDDADIFALMPIHSSWSIKDIRIINDAITAGTDYNLGIYSQDGGTITDVDENVYGDAIDMSSARVVWTSVNHEILDQASVKQQVWEDVAASEDPNDFYYLCLTAITVGSAAGTISVQVLYTRPGGA